MHHYRSDIDGLRGLAVLLVLLFHVKAPWFAGGFIGVDIFIVISGFLITSLVMRGIEDGSFRLGEFYVRRMRRLFPALFATIGLAFVGAYFILTPQYFARMAGSAIYALVSLSNFYFWQERGYFDTEAVFKPLLHTWSLSVEEQFYLVWPLALLGLWRLRKTQALAPILVGGVILLSLWASQRMLWIDRGAAFFLTPFRVFEFAIGGTLYWVGRWPLPTPILRAAAYAAGLALIAVSMTISLSSDQFPGWRALIPCAGAFLLLYAGEQNPVAKALDNRVMAAIGKISYSLYLVHWPIISLYRAATYADLTTRERILVLAASFLAATLMYHLIEKPFRYRRSASAPGASARFALVSVAAALIACLSLAQVWASGGWTWRYPPELRGVADHREKDLIAYTWSNWPYFVGDAFETGKKKVLVVGDSQAADLLNLMVEGRLDQTYSVRVVGVDSNCSAIWIPPEKLAAYETEESFDLKTAPAAAAQCREQRARAFASPLLKSADVILWAPLWTPWNENYLAPTLQKLRELTPAGVIVVGSKIWLSGSIDIALRRGRIEGLSEYGATFAPESTFTMNTRLSAATEANGAAYFDLMRFLCPARTSCHVLTPAMRPTLHNAGHYSSWGSAFVSRMATEPLKALIETRAKAAPKTAGKS